MLPLQGGSPSSLPSLFIVICRIEVINEMHPIVQTLYKVLTGTSILCSTHERVFDHLSRNCLSLARFWRMISAWWQVWQLYSSNGFEVQKHRAIEETVKRVLILLTSWWTDQRWPQGASSLFLWWRKGMEDWDWHANWEIITTITCSLLLLRTPKSPNRQSLYLKR